MIMLDDFFQDQEFYDKFSEKNQEIPIDIIIPVLNTSFFFKKNLISLYREFSVNRILLGDGGCIDNTLSLISQFPRVKIFDHKGMKSQGGSIVDLIMNVETKYFAYFHADVWIPKGFGDQLAKENLDNKWIESNRVFLNVKELKHERFYKDDRSYSGAQFGDTELLKKSLKSVDDDFLQRNEDIIIRELVEKNNGKFEKKESLIHLHQQTSSANLFGKGQYQNHKWLFKIYNMHFKGIIKYLDPPDFINKKRIYLLDQLEESFSTLKKINKLDWDYCIDWTNKVNPAWLPYLKYPDKKQPFLLRIIIEILKRIIKALKILIYGTNI